MLVNKGRGFIQSIHSKNARFCLQQIIIYLGWVYHQPFDFFPSTAMNTGILRVSYVFNTEDLQLDLGGLEFSGFIQRWPFDRCLETLKVCCICIDWGMEMKIEDGKGKVRGKKCFFCSFFDNTKKLKRDNEHMQMLVIIPR